MVAFFEGVSLPALAGAAGIALLRFIGRYLEEGDPWRQLIAQARLYAEAFVGIAVSMWCGTGGRDMFGDGFEQSTVLRTGSDV